MEKHHYYTANQCMRCVNTNLFVYSIYESIVLDNITVAGLTNFGLEIKNNSAAGNVIDVSIYASPNGVDYYPLESHFFDQNIGPGEIDHCDFVVVTGFLRVSVKTDADINIDIYLHGNLT